LEGLVLDIGCGPHIPSYLQDKKIEFGIGIDPLIEVGGDHEEKLDFLNAVGEFLPFRHEFFDFVCFATSFDHVLDHILVLKETRRVLKEGGIVIFWVGEKAITRSNILNRSFKNLSRASKKIQRIIFKKNARLKQRMTDPRVEAQASKIRSMQIPNGAIDQFHLKHIYYNELNDLCELLEFKKIDEKLFPSGVFVKYKKA
jgi:ubiquinone/menaquinone biosynthesis C-methylase UbiE